jgi:hypothetical protein
MKSESPLNPPSCNYKILTRQVIMLIGKSTVKFKIFATGAFYRDTSRGAFLIRTSSGRSVSANILPMNVISLTNLTKFLHELAHND